MSRVKRLGKYELLARIGVGGMAEVYLARQRGPMNFEKVVVVKTIHPHLASEEKFINMLLDEARIAALIKHPRVVDIYELGEVDHRYFISMEYIVGQPLTRVIKAGRRGKPLDVLSTAQLIADAADGLHAAHELKTASGKCMELVHRDVTPGNIIVLYDGNVKLVDFGVSKAEGERYSHTQAGKLKGKIGYLAPEQIAGKDVDRRCDIFSLGVVLWEAIALGRLFAANNALELMEMMLGWEAEPPSRYRTNVPEELDEICLRALSRDPADRFQTAREMRLALLNLLRSEGYYNDQSATEEYMAATFGAQLDQQRQLIGQLADPTGTAELSIEQIEEIQTGIQELYSDNQIMEKAPVARSQRPATNVPIEKHAETTAVDGKPVPAKDEDEDGDDGEEQAGEPTRVEKNPLVVRPPKIPRAARTPARVPPINKAAKPKGSAKTAKRDSSSTPAGPKPRSAGGPPLVPPVRVIERDNDDEATILEPAPDQKGLAIAQDRSSDRHEVSRPIPIVSDMTEELAAVRAWPSWVKPAMIGGAVLLASLAIALTTTGSEGDSGRTGQVAGSVSDSDESESTASFDPGEGGADPESEPSTDPAPEPEPAPEDQPTAEPEPALEPEPDPVDAANATVTARPATKPEPKPAAKPEPKPAAKPEPKPAVKPQPKPATKPEPKPAAKPEPKPPTEPEPKSAAKPEPQPEPAPTTKPETEPADSENSSNSRRESARNRAQEYYQAGAQLLVSGNFDGAKRKFRAALSVYSGYAPAYRGLGITHERSGSNKNAIRAFKRYLKLRPNAKDASSIRKRIKRLGG